MDYFSNFETVFTEVSMGKFEAVMEVEPVSEKWFNNGFSAQSMVGVDSEAACITDLSGNVIAYIGGGDDCRALAELVEGGEGLFTWRKESNEKVVVEVLVFEEPCDGSGGFDFTLRWGSVLGSVNLWNILYGRTYDVDCLQQIR